MGNHDLPSLIETSPTNGYANGDDHHHNGNGYTNGNGHQIGNGHQNGNGHDNDNGEDYDGNDSDDLEEQELAAKVIQVSNLC
jgi:hypothetical protein